jgi:sugar/nucleoside kinase (ribokinase family)
MPPFFSDQQRRRTLDITGIENAILDLLVQVKDYLIDDLGLIKGTMKLVNTEEQAHILDVVGSLKPEISPGGSCSNVLTAASHLGARCCYSSAVAEDVFGEAFEQGLEKHGVLDRCVQLEGATGTSVILVSPDGERTMNTHLGVCRDYSKAHVPTSEIENSRIFFTTGYMWDTPNQIEAIEQALASARANNCKLALDLADPFAVDRSKARLLKHIEEGLDVVFANGEEARMLTDLECRAAAEQLGSKVAIAVVKDGANGAWICADGDLIHVPVEPVKVVDTTGAGDCFAAGFLYGLVRGLDVETCGRVANLLAGDTIGHLGVKLSPDISERVHALC